MAKPSCGQNQSQDIYMKLIDELESRNLYGDVTVTPTGCLGPCFDGPSIVVYPEGVWYAKVTPDDVAEIAENHMQNGKPVERLIYKWPENCA